jgi:hypothetical protein
MEENIAQRPFADRLAFTNISINAKAPAIQQPHLCFNPVWPRSVWPRECSGESASNNICTEITEVA